jgi:uncharacterized membrane protein YccC
MGMANWVARQPAASARIESQAATGVFERFRADDLRGVRFALNTFIGAAALWFFLRLFSELDPIWAIASMIAASEPVVGDALHMFRARMTNAAVGCAVGLAVLLTGQSSELKMPIAIAIAVLVSSYFVRIPTMWRQAPITAALVIGSGLMQHSKLTGVEDGLTRVGEVFLGCVVGLVVSWLLAHIWPMPEGPAVKSQTK